MTIRSFVLMNLFLSINILHGQIILKNDEDNKPFIKLNDSTYFHQLKDHIGDRTVRHIFETKNRYNSIKSNEKITMSLAPYDYIWRNAGFTQEQNDSVNTLLNQIYINVYDRISKRDIIRYPHAYAQLGYVEFYDSVVAQISNLSAEYVPIQTFTLTAHNDLNEFILISIGSEKWSESTIDFSSITYNCSITTSIDSDAIEGLANHIQLTSLRFFYNELQQLELDIDISLETGQRIVESHYVAAFCDNKTSKKVKKNPEKSALQYPYKKCFCDGEDFCPITYLLVKYNTYPVSNNALFQVGSGFPNFIEVNKTQNIEQEFELLYNPYRGENLSVSGIELVPTGWERVWYPDGGLYSRKFYTTPYFVEQGEYGKTELSGVILDSSNKVVPTSYGIYLNGFESELICYSLGNIELIQRSSDSLYYTLNSSFVKDSVVWLEFIRFSLYEKSDTIIVNTHETIENLSIILLIHGPEYEPGIKWPLKDRDQRESERLYHILSTGKETKIIFFPNK